MYHVGLQGKANVFEPSSPYRWDPHKVVFSYYDMHNIKSERMW
jgi:hypothetical protein